MAKESRRTDHKYLFDRPTQRFNLTGCKNSYTARDQPFPNACRCRCASGYNSTFINSGLRDNSLECNTEERIGLKCRETGIGEFIQNVFARNRPSDSIHFANHVL